MQAEASKPFTRMAVAPFAPLNLPTPYGPHGLSVHPNHPDFQEQQQHLLRLQQQQRQQQAALQDDMPAGMSAAESSAGGDLPVVKGIPTRPCGGGGGRNGCSGGANRHKTKRSCSPRRRRNR
eukprot:GHVU01108382.1.p3 GENE.GHVU01108382.1~~GHVU01108382.1.p3  ORF type:complete len:122 (+),score=33.96 GHVU01108382.1:164-529(+)